MPPLMHYQFEKPPNEFYFGGLLKNCTFVLVEVPALWFPTADAFNKSHGTGENAGFSSGCFVLCALSGLRR